MLKPESVTSSLPISATGALQGTQPTPPDDEVRRTEVLPAVEAEPPAPEARPAVQHFGGDDSDDADHRRGDEAFLPAGSPVRSPLWMVSQEPLLNELVAYLDGVRADITANPERSHALKFSRSHLRAVRAEFDTMIRRGEQALHQLCGMLSASFFPGHRLQSVVIAEVPRTGERFTLSQFLSREELYATSDIDLGSRQLAKFRYVDGSDAVRPILVANVVEYQPTSPTTLGIHRIISRIKAEEEIWNKVTDEIFGLDALVRRDKKLLRMSHYVKDIFGLKIVVGDDDEVLALHDELGRFSFSGELLAASGLATTPETAGFEWLETKNYLGTEDRKASGWEAIKSVVRWNGKMFELQIQPLQNFWREREMLTKESHAGFKSRREEVRDAVAARIPLFKFFRQLLWWLFHDLTGPPPEFDRVILEIVP